MGSTYRVIVTLTERKVRTQSVQFKVTIKSPTVKVKHIFYHYESMAQQKDSLCCFEYEIESGIQTIQRWKLETRNKRQTERYKEREGGVQTNLFPFCGKQQKLFLLTFDIIFLLHFLR